jgi:hypothetical protein
MNSIEDFRLRPKKDLLPIVSNLVLVLLIVGVLSVAFYRYRSRMEEISLSENRYLTTEWRLLQELKEQTDEKLQEKDQEIAELNDRYLRLLRQNASPSAIRQVETRLQQAKVERAEIATRQAEAAAQQAESAPEAPQSAAQDRAWLRDLLPSENQSALTRLLQNRLETSEAERESQRRRIEELENSLIELDAAAAAIERSRALETAERQETVRALSSALEGLESAAIAAAADLEEKALGGEVAEHPRMEDLSSLALVRALASSPEIRSEYPQLLDSLDRYLEIYGRLERREGRREAYTAAAATVRGLIR